MADDLQAVGIFVGDDRQLAVALDAEAGVDKLAIDLAGDGCAGESGADAVRHFGNRDRLRVFTLRTIGQGDDRHVRLWKKCTGRPFYGKRTGGNGKT